MEDLDRLNEELKSQKEKERLQREQELDDVRRLLNLPAGMRFFKRLLEEGHIFHTTFTGNSNTYFLEGHRNLVLKFFADVCEAAPHKVGELMVNKQEIKNDKRG